MSGKYTKAQAKAAEKYLKNFERITIRVPKGEKKIYEEKAKKNGKSLNQYIIDCINKET